MDSLKLDSLGLKVVYEPPHGEKPKVDVVYVHGLGSDTGSQVWTNYDNTGFWIWDLLPTAIQSPVRIMIFNYDGRVSSLLAQHGSIRDLAQGLTLQLRDPMYEVDGKMLPLIFMCHNLGGLIVKAAVVGAVTAGIEQVETNKLLLPRVQAILFFATPQRRTREKGTWRNVLDTVDHVYTRGSFSTSATEAAATERSNELVRALNVYSESDDISNLFLEVVSMAVVQIYSFYETRSMRSNLPLVLSKESAILSLPNERTVPMNADHRSMVRFSSASDPDFQRVVSVYKEIVRDLLWYNSQESVIAALPTSPLLDRDVQIVPGELKYKGDEVKQYFIHYDSVGQHGFGYVDIVEAVIDNGTPLLLTGDRPRKKYARKAVAVKDQDLYRLTDLRREAENLRKTRHHHMARLELCYQHENNRGVLEFVTVTSPYATGDLRDFLNHRGRFSVDRKTDKKYQQYLLRWFGCLAKALEFLQRSQVRHMDIKPENILVLDDEVLLTDFGISKDMTGTADGRTGGPLSIASGHYLAPEIVRKQERGYESDLYSLGCVFLEMLTDFCTFRHTDLHMELRAAHDARLGDGGCALCAADPARREDDFAYHHHPVAVLRWLCGLVGPCRDCAYWKKPTAAVTAPLRLAPLGWTFAMLQPDERRRVRVASLVRAIEAVEDAQRNSTNAIALPTDEAVEVFLCERCTGSSSSSGGGPVVAGVAGVLSVDTGNTLALGATVPAMSSDRARLAEGLDWVEKMEPASWDEANEMLGWVEFRE